ncbi:MAG TPA: class I adenylate-forming enzyme family protein [Chthoniobacterales bacterium]|jgi:long-chain acyl-CoA synthetase
MPSSPLFLLERWACVLENKAAEPALFDAGGNVLATFAEIDSDSRVWGEKLWAFPARSVVGIQLGNHPAWPAVLLAIWRNDQIALPLDASLRSELTGQILQTASASALILESGIQPLASATAACFSADTSLFKVTSGTTGTPRLIAFTLSQIGADSDHICATMGLRETDVNYGAIPLSHSYGFSNLLTPLLTQGIPLVVEQDNLPHAMVAGLTNTHATVLAGIPVLYQSLTRLGLDLPPHVRLCITAGAPLSSEVARAFHKLTGRKIHSFYGASECGGICYDASEEVDLLPGFVGQPLTDVDVEWNTETKRIVVKSGAVGLGYHPAGADDSLTAGEFRPSDLVELTSDGYRITGRVSDFINITGKKLDPQIVESVIEKLPYVSRAVICGVPHERRGELAIAIVETSHATTEEILAACRQSLAPWQVPSDVWLMEQIPVTERGKINRRILAEAYLRRSQSSQ